MPRKREIIRDTRNRMFAAAYVRAFDGVEAARAAGFKGSAHVLAVRASEMLKRPAVQELLRQLAAEAELSARDVLKVLGQQLRGSMAMFLNKTSYGWTIDLDKAAALGATELIAESDLEAVKDADGNDTGQRVIRKIKLYDKQAAAVQLGRILGMYVEKHEIKAVKTPGDMSDEDAIALYQRLGVPRERWLPGLRRRFEMRKEKALEQQAKTPEGKR